MADITIGSNTYKSLATVAFADEFLAGDLARGAVWEAVTDEDQKGRALVTATRVLLSRVAWATVPDPDATVPDATQQATAMLAADLIAKPALASNPSGASNVKRAYAEGSGVEFFKADDTATTPIPADIWALLVAADLVGSTVATGGPYYSGYRTEPVFGFDHECPLPDEETRYG